MHLYLIAFSFAANGCASALGAVAALPRLLGCLPTRSNEIKITSLEKKNLKDNNDFFILMAY